MYLNEEQALSLKAKYQSLSEDLKTGVSDLGNLSKAQSRSKWGTQVGPDRFRLKYVSELYEIERALAKLEGDIGQFSGDYERAIVMMRDTDDDARAALQVKGNPDLMLPTQKPVIAQDGGDLLEGIGGSTTGSVAGSETASSPLSGRGPRMTKD